MRREMKLLQITLEQTEDCSSAPATPSSSTSKDASELGRTASRVKQCLFSCTNHLSAIKRHLSFQSEALQEKGGLIDNLQSERALLVQQLRDIELGRAEQEEALAALEKLVNCLNEDATVQACQFSRSQEDVKEGAVKMDMLRSEVLRLQSLVERLEKENLFHVSSVSELQEKLDSCEQSRLWTSKQVIRRDYRLLSCPPPASYLLN